MYFQCSSFLDPCRQLACVTIYVLSGSVFSSRMFYKNLTVLGITGMENMILHFFTEYLYDFFYNLLSYIDMFYSQSDFVYRLKCWTVPA